MEAIRIPIEVSSRSEIVSFFPIGDVHLGANSCEEKAFKRLLRKVAATNNAYVILMGDLIDAITRTDPRFDSGGLADWIPIHRANTIAEVELEYAVELLEPIKDKIVGAIVGNHEDKVAKHYGTDIHQRMCTHLGIRNLSYSALIRFAFKRANERSSIDVYAHHGHGGGRKAGAKVNRMHDEGGDVAADIYLMGHVHERGWSMKPILHMHKDKPLLVAKERHFGLTGTYLRTYKQGYSGYAEKSGFPPTSIGGIKWTVAFPETGPRITTINDA